MKFFREKDPTFRDYLIQVALKELGYYEGGLDNWAGPQTKEAYDKFHKEKVEELGKDLPPKSGESGTSMETGVNRTDWRGFVDIPESSLRAVLPQQADPIVPSVLKYARQYNLNPLFLLSISQHETASWTSNVFRTKNNAFGISNTKGAIYLPSYDESVRRAAYSLGRPGGYYSQAKTLGDVAAIYAPAQGHVENDPGRLNQYWPNAVLKYWQALEKNVAINDYRPPLVS